MEKTQCLPLYRYQNEERIDNITDWGLEQFRQHYGQTNSTIIRKEDIFHYVYAILHHPAYRTKYELNLKREFPRIPFYDNFWQWAQWGKQLMDLHINYEKAEPFALTVIARGEKGDSEKSGSTSLTNPKQSALLEKQIASPNSKARNDVKAKLKADKATGIILLDEETELNGIPATAWDYKLGNRSALEWILDQYKEKKPTDPTIAEKFNTYKFADYKDQVIDLLKRVCTVSVETMKIVNEMP
jgi:predicted helicase